MVASTRGPAQRWWAGPSSTGPGGSPGARTQACLSRAQGERIYRVPLEGV